jgi:hypothetical protein
MRVNVNDGSFIDLPRTTVEELYDLMWLIARERGAVTTAAKLRQALHRARVPGDHVTLEASESQVFSDALQRLS